MRDARVVWLPAVEITDNYGFGFDCSIHTVLTEAIKQQKHFISADKTRNRQVSKW